MYYYYEASEQYPVYTLKPQEHWDETSHCIPLTEAEYLAYLTASGEWDKVQQLIHQQVTRVEK